LNHVKKKGIGKLIIEDARKKEYKYVKNGLTDSDTKQKTKPKSDSFVPYSGGDSPTITIHEI